MHSFWNILNSSTLFHGRTWHSEEHTRKWAESERGCCCYWQKSHSSFSLSTPAGSWQQRSWNGQMTLFCDTTNSAQVILARVVEGGSVPIYVNMLLRPSGQGNHNCYRTKPTSIHLQTAFFIKVKLLLILGFWNYWLAVLQNSGSPYPSGPGTKRGIKMRLSCMKTGSESKLLDKNILTI